MENVNNDYSSAVQAGSQAGNLTEKEMEQMRKILTHPANTGYVLFDPNSEILESANIDEELAPALAHVFDLCDGLSGDLGQQSHMGTVFEGREQEISCHRLNGARLVVFRSKAAGQR